MLERRFGCIAVSGLDAHTFLQGQLTCDVTKVTRTPCFGAYCDAKGRMLANFWIAKVDASYQICLPDSMLETVLATLKKYAVFSKVQLAECELDPTIFDSKHNPLDYIHEGIAFVVPQTSLLFTPQMINWERHGGVSFDKGCYLGQEVVARTQHLGKLKRHLHQFTSASNVLPCPGEKLVNSQNEAKGVVCDAALEEDRISGLAVIQDEALADRLLCDGVEIVVSGRTLRFD